MGVMDCGCWFLIQLYRWFPSILQVVQVPAAKTDDD
jgi:hypothetical protein